MHLFTSDGRHAWFHLHGTSRPARSALEATKYKMKNSCPQWDSNPQPLDLKSDALPTELAGLGNAVHLNGLITYMYSKYQCLPCYKYQNYEVERNLSCKCTVLCYILEYNEYCTNNKETHKSCACFQHANTRSCRMFGSVCMLKASTWLLCLFAICTIFIYIPICNTKQYINQTEYAVLYHSRTYNNVYIGIGSTCM